MDEGSLTYDQNFDVVIVGFGGAGVSAALEALEHQASVAIVDRFQGGGATAISGSVIYAGGGTALQRRLGVLDSPENMYCYLRQEVGDVVSDTTLRRFCDGSVANMSWLESHGVRFSGDLFPYKTTYPVDGYSLYYSGNETDLAYSKDSDPAARGHIPDGIAKLSAMGPAFFKPMAKAVAALAPNYFTQCRAERLIVSPAGEVKAVEIADLRRNRWAAFRHRIWSRLARCMNRAWHR